MGRRSHSPIALAGWPLFLGAILLAVIAAQYQILLALPFVILLGVLFYLFRDPWRKIPADPLAIVSPLDGQVIEVARTNNPLTAHLDQRITIQFAKLGAYTVHSATEGKIATLRRDGPDIQQRGKNLTALTILVNTDEGDDVVMVVHRGYLGHYPKCYHTPGERVGQGRRLSYVPFGTRIDLYIPDTARISIKEGDKLVAAETTLAHFVHK